MVYYPIIRSDLLEYKNYEDHARLKVKFLQMNVNLNSTANLIYMLCLRKFSISEIVVELEKKFPEQVNKSQIEKDVNAILKSFYENGFLDWKDINPFENIIYKNENIRIIKRWANNEESLIPQNIEYLSPYIKKTTFKNALLLKSSILAGSLKLYEIKDSLDKQVSTIFLNLDKSQNIIVLNCLNVENSNLLIKYFKEIISKISFDLNKEYKKVSNHEYIILAYATDEKHQLYLKKLGFKIIGNIDNDFIENVNVLSYV